MTVYPEFNKHTLRRILLVFFIFFVLEGKAQRFDISIARDKLTIEGTALEGYATDFDFSAKKVEYGWWKYCKNFGRPLNMKTYYKVTVPPLANSGNIDLELYSRALDSKSGSRFFLALNTADIPKDKVSLYDQQVKIILREFKKSYYIQVLETELEKLEKKAKKVSKRVHKASDRNRESILRELTDCERQMTSVRQKLRHIYTAHQD